MPACVCVAKGSKGRVEDVAVDLLARLEREREEE